MDKKSLLCFGWKMAQDLAWRKVENEGVILNLRTSEYFSFNQAGTFIWELLCRGTAPASISRKLAEEFEINEGRAACDLEEFLRTLCAEKLIEKTSR
ncbi:MAG: PqqD family protein [bacterium]